MTKNDVVLMMAQYDKIVANIVSLGSSKPDDRPSDITRECETVFNMMMLFSRRFGPENITTQGIIEAMLLKFTAKKQELHVHADYDREYQDLLILLRRAEQAGESGS